jgi:hypothetical protein
MDSADIAGHEECVELLLRKGHNGRRRSSLLQIPGEALSLLLGATSNKMYGRSSSEGSAKSSVCSRASRIDIDPVADADAFMSRSLCSAASEGDTEEVKRLIVKGGNPRYDFMIFVPLCVFVCLFVGMYFFPRTFFSYLFLLSLL